MKHARIAIFKKLRWLVLASTFLACTAFADSYADVNQLIRAGKFDDALTQVDAYLLSQPADPQMRFFKGIIQSHSGQQAQAIATMIRLTEDYPELPEPHNNLAVLYAAQGHFEKARSALEMAVRANPGYATAHENLGDVYAHLASQAYNKALQHDVNNATVPPKLILITQVLQLNGNQAKLDLQEVGGYGLNTRAVTGH